MTDPAPRVLFVCTGNATRSVLAARLLAQQRPDWPVTSRGTMVYEGLASSRRTRAAMASVGVPDHPHSSRQLRAGDVADADLVVGFEGHHVEYVRRHHPAAAGRTATLRRLVEHLPHGAEPLADRVADLGLQHVTLAAWEEVDDPAGGETADFIACAAEIDALVRALLPRLA